MMKNRYHSGRMKGPEPHINAMNFVGLGQLISSASEACQVRLEEDLGMTSGDRERDLWNSVPRKWGKSPK